MTIIDRIKLHIVKREAEKMFILLRQAVAGYKTYVVAGLTVLIPLVGFLYGPLDIMGVHIPQVDFATLFTAIQVSGVATTIRAALARATAPKLVLAVPTTPAVIVAPTGVK